MPRLAAFKYTAIVLNPKMIYIRTRLKEKEIFMMLKFSWQGNWKEVGWTFKRERRSFERGMNTYFYVGRNYFKRRDDLHGSISFYRDDFQKLFLSRNFPKFWITFRIFSRPAPVMGSENGEYPHEKWLEVILSGRVIKSKVRDNVI